MPIYYCQLESLNAESVPVKNLTKPLGTSAGKKKQQAKTQKQRQLGKFLVRVPFVTLSVLVLAGVGTLALIWVAIFDNPDGGEPIVNVRIVEPKFDSADRDVGVVSVREKASLSEIDDGLDDEPTVLTELKPPEDEETLEPLDPDEVLIYDPSKIAAPRKKISLSTVGDKALLERSRYGFLPKVGANGEKPLLAYSRPNRGAATSKSRIAIVIGGLGLNKSTTQRTLSELPAEMTLAFAPYADGLLGLMKRARTRGHELLMQLPLEPFDYPNNDPGPRTLLVENDWKDNQDKLHWLLSRMTNYVGVINYLGARYSASPDALGTLFVELQRRGLMYVDDGSTPLSRAGEVAYDRKLPFAQSSIVLDAVLTQEDIDARLLELESLARDKGTVVGVASAFPVTIDRLARWAKDAERRGIKLIPISGTLDKSSF